MSAYKERGRWCIDVTHNRVRYRKRSPKNTRKDAVAYENHIRHQLSRGINPFETKKKEVAPRLNEFANEWMRDYVANTNTTVEQSKKRSVLDRHILPLLGKKRLDQITMADIERFKASQLGNGLSPKTVHNNMSVLRTALSYARDMGVVSTLPTFKWPKKQRKEAQCYTPAEIQQLLNHDPDHSIYSFIMMAVHTGMRISEVLALDWKQVHLSGDVPHIKVVHALDANNEIKCPKNGKERLAYIGPAFRIYLEELREEKGGKGRVCMIDGKPIQRQRSYEHLKKYCKEAGVPYRAWHSFRHAYITGLSRFAPAATVQRLVGHSSLEMTQRYTHIHDEWLSAAAKQFDGEMLQLRQHSASKEKVFKKVHAS